MVELQRAQDLATELHARPPVTGVAQDRAKQDVVAAGLPEGAGLGGTINRPQQLLLLPDMPGVLHRSPHGRVVTVVAEPLVLARSWPTVDRPTSFETAPPSTWLTV